MRRGYPLESLERLRRYRTEVATEGVRQAVRERTRAEELLEEQREGRQRLQAQWAERRDREGQRLQAGVGRAVDLQRSEEYRRTVEAELRESLGAEREREKLAASARNAESEARRVASRKLGQALAVERHHGAWAKAVQREREERESEEAAEIPRGSIRRA